MKMHRRMQVTFREYRAGDAAIFRVLNQQWISKDFGLEAKDLEILSDPEKYILQPGAHVYFAIDEDEIVGCCALLVNGAGSFELAKMAVGEDCRNQGIGRALLAHVIEAARTLGVRQLTLETNRMLANAIHLYESLGSQNVPHWRIKPSPYKRADVYMEMLL
jgi:putative acetyltransferase